MSQRGIRLRAFAAAILDARTMERVVDPAIADLRHEPCSIPSYFAVFKVVVLCLRKVPAGMAVSVWVGGVDMVRRTMRCSFCRRPDSEVEKLVAGPWRPLAGRVYICDRCATQTIQIMEGHPGNPGPHPQAESLLRRTLHRLGWSRDDDRHSRSECHAT
jgi:hypothetical protein